jgi:hypothetical protein
MASPHDLTLLPCQLAKFVSLLTGQVVQVRNGTAFIAFSQELSSVRCRHFFDIFKFSKTFTIDFAYKGAPRLTHRDNSFLLIIIASLLRTCRHDELKITRGAKEYARSDIDYDQGESDRKDPRES